MKLMPGILSATALMLSASLVHAETAATPPPLPPPLPPVIAPSAPDTGTLPAPEVRIYRRDRESVQEFSINGQVYMVRIMPDRGYPYYLIDQDGDGQLESRTYSPANPHMLTPQWLLFSW